MRIIIVGAGEVGSYLAKRLAHAQHDVTVIEVDPVKCQQLQNTVDCMIVQGSGVSPKRLIEAGAHNADLLVAASSVDEVNLMACVLANSLGIPRKVARVRNLEYSDKEAPINPKQLGIDLMIHPEVVAAEHLVNLIRRTYATDVIEYSAAKMQMLGIRIESRDAPIVGRPLAEIVRDYPDVEFRTVAILRGTRTIIPKGNDQIFNKDQIFVIAKDESLPEVLKLVGKEETQLRRMMVLGGGRIGRYVAKAMENDKGLKIKLIEANAEKSQTVASELSNTLVLQGDGTDLDLLATEGITEMDAFVASTNDDENNLVSCLLAKHLGVKRVIGLVNKSEYLPVINTIGLNAAVSPKVAVADEILRYVRRGKIVSISTLREIDAEVMEIVTPEDSPITKKPLKDTRLPDGAIISALYRNGESIIPVGSTQLQANDLAVVVTLPEAIEGIEKAFT
jgi:trk system potassium uptake protein